jgi:hypothetical protein
MAAAFLNNDFLIDLLVYDWVKSELHALYGVGRGRFLDQSTFPVSGEVESIDARPTRERGPLDLILTIRNPRSVQVWEGNDLGDFRARENQFTFEPHSTVHIIEVDTSKQIGLISGGGSREAKVFPHLDDSENSVSVAGTLEIRDALWLNLKDSGPALALLGNDGKELVVVQSLSEPVALRDSLVLAAGSGTMGVCFTARESSGSSKIISINSGSRSLSAFIVGKDGAIQAHRQIQLDTSATDISLIPFGDSTMHAILTDANQGILTNAKVHVYERSMESNIIPAAVGTTVRFASRRGESVEFGTEVRTGGTPAASYSFFRQLNESQFLEQTFRLPEPYEIVGGAFGDINRDGFPDLVILFHHPDSASLELATSFGDSAMTMKQVGEPHETSLPSSTRTFVWLVDMNADDSLDLVCLMPDRQGAMYVLAGAGESRFAAAKQLAAGINLNRPADLQIVDCNFDKLPDMVFRDGNTESLRWWKNETGGSKIETPRHSNAIGYLNVPGRFSVGDLNGDGFPEIAITEPRLGRLKIFDGAQFFK